MTNPNGALNDKIRRRGLNFPRDIDTMPAFFMINMRPYVAGDNAPSGSGQYIYLPMPVQGLEDNFHIDYDPMAMGALGGVGASIMQPGNIIGNILSGIEQFGLGAAKSVAEAFGDQVGVSREVSGAATDLLTGVVDNPNYAVLFKGVKPRTFSFTWRLVPKNITESEELTDIINTLKKASLPSRGFGGNFTLNYPNIAELAVIGPNSSKMLTFAKNGAFIEDIGVDYSGPGHATFFKGSKHPVQVNLTLRFRERGIVTSEDVGGADRYSVL